MGLHNVSSFLLDATKTTESSYDDQALHIATIFLEEPKQEPKQILKKIIPASRLMV
ncbi:MAG: hypothetical protein MHMPM18_000541 [Marteilia pararefringens]